MNNSLSINCQGAMNIAPTANERTNSSIAESLQFNPHQITLPNEDSIAPQKTITDSLDEIHQHNETAKKANIDIAKKDFIAQISKVVLAGVGLGLAIAGTVLTAGAGAPLIAATGVAFTLAVADAGTGFAHWRDLKAGGEGFTMKGDSVAGFVNWAASKCTYTEQYAKTMGTVTSAVSRAGLLVGTIYASPAEVAGVAGKAITVVEQALHVAHKAHSLTELPSKTAEIGLEKHNEKLKSAEKDLKQRLLDRAENQQDVIGGAKNLVGELRSKVHTGGKVIHGMSENIAELEDRVKVQNSLVVSKDQQIDTLKAELESAENMLTDVRLKLFETIFKLSGATIPESRGRSHSVSF